MTDEERRAFGRRVAMLRKQRGMTQEELAVAVGRTASWMSQVERGVQPVNRLDVLRLLADQLGMPLQSLRPEAPLESAAQRPRIEEVNDLDRARLLISGHAVPAVILAAPQSAIPADLSRLRGAVDAAWELAHSNRFAELSGALEPLVPELELSVRTAHQRDRPELWLLLSRTYQALAAAFVRQNESDAAWVAADRAIQAAERSDAPLQVFAGVFRLVQAFVRLKRFDQAAYAASGAVAAVGVLAQQADAEPEALSILGALHLLLAFIGARVGNRAQAQAELALAREVAQRLGGDRNDFNLEFGPTNVEIQAVSIAIELGDAGQAIAAGQPIDATGMSIERRARLLMDLGRAYAQRRQSGEALDCLLRAEALAPETVRAHGEVRDAVRDLVLIAGRSASAELQALAERMDA